MENKKTEFINALISKMTLEQKVGQCMVLGFVGTVITPEILKRIRDYYPSGIRAGMYWRVRTSYHDPGGTNAEYAHRVWRTPVGTVKDFVRDLPVPHCTNAEFCEFLNTLKQAAADRDFPLPLHITFDMEGDISSDYYRGGTHYFPSFKGIAEADSPQMAYDVAWGVARQMVPLGFSWTHSLVLDVNTHPMNPEIGTRSFGSDPDTVTEYARQALRGYTDGGLISTGKHFPGRGESAMDAHANLPVIDISREELEPHLAPYRALIKEGLPVVMAAHTVYPQLDPSGLPATLSKTIITDLLKNEMGFAGPVAVDEMTMGGIIEKFELAEACILSLNAGADVILIRDEGPIIDEVFPAIVEAVCKGRLPLERIEDAVRRALSLKYDFGFFEEDANHGIKDPEKAGDGINDEKVIKLARTSAKSVLTVLRDEQNLLPLSPSTNVLLIEQINWLHEMTNTQQCHPCLFWEKLLQHSESVGIVETRMNFSDEDRERVRARFDQADIIIMTNYFNRRQSDGNAFVQEIHSWGKPVIVVTNSPYPFTVQPEYGTVIVTYGCSPETLEETAKLIYGKTS
jgi:beta-N-acetylhexosaminidase